MTRHRHPGRRPPSAHSHPSPLTIVLAVAAVGYVLWSRMKAGP